MQDQTSHERRRHTRFEVGDGFFAQVKAGVQTLGQLLNVSEGGLAIKYLSEFGSALGQATLDIFGSGKKVLANVPVRAVSDFETPKEVDFSTVRLRRMGLAFEALTDTQKEELKRFLSENRLE